MRFSNWPMTIAGRIPGFRLSHAGSLQSVKVPAPALKAQTADMVPKKWQDGKRKTGCLPWNDFRLPSIFSVARRDWFFNRSLLSPASSAKGPSGCRVSSPAVQPFWVTARVNWPCGESFEIRRLHAEVPAPAIDERFVEHGGIVCGRVDRRCVPAGQTATGAPPRAAPRNEEMASAAACPPATDFQQAESSVAGRR